MDDPTNINYSLSFEDIKNKLNKFYPDDKFRMELYDNLINFNTIDDLFGNDDIIFILYRFGNNYGHWCCLTRQTEDPKYITFFDSYGKFIDDTLDSTPIIYKPELSDLLYRHLEENKKNQVEYNNYQMQQFGDNISTCGRFCILWSLYKDMPIDNFISILKNIQKKGYNLDQVVTEITNRI